MNDVYNDDIDTTLFAMTMVVTWLLSTLKQKCQDMAEENEIVMQHILPILLWCCLNRYYALQRVSHQQQKWAPFKRDLTDRQFRQYF